MTNEAQKKALEFIVSMNDTWESVQNFFGAVAGNPNYDETDKQNASEAYDMIGVSLEKLAALITELTENGNG